MKEILLEQERQNHDSVFGRIDALLCESGKNPVVIAIDGKSGSGKSTLGHMLQKVYHCNLFHTDDFFLRPEQRTQERFAQPGGNVDYERLKAEILEPIQSRREICYQPYDCRRQCLGGFIRAGVHRLNIIEGVYSQHPYFGEVYDLRFFMALEEEEQVERIRKRNGEVMLERFRKEWIPLENRYFECCGITEHSILIDGMAADS